MYDPAADVQSATSYVVDAENVAEMARLIRQARTLSDHFHLLPESLAVAPGERILDVGCGPGEWVVAMARRFPDSRVTGIDISERMIDYARYVAHDRKLVNTQFEVMDIGQPLPFADASFDLVHARFLVGAMSTALWPRLLRECSRILRSGGSFCTCEPESLGTTTSMALAHYNLAVTQAMRKAGKCFAPFGEQYGITTMQYKLLLEAGFQNLHQEALSINYSFGMPAHLPTVENFTTFLKLLQPLIVHSGHASQEEIEILYARTMKEMQSADFYATAFFQRVWGNKP